MQIFLNWLLFLLIDWQTFCHSIHTGTLATRFQMYHELQCSCQTEHKPVSPCNNESSFRLINRVPQLLPVTRPFITCVKFILRANSFYAAVVVRADVGNFARRQRGERINEIDGTKIINALTLCRRKFAWLMHLKVGQWMNSDTNQY